MFLPGNDCLLLNGTQMKRFGIALLLAISFVQLVAQNGRAPVVALDHNNHDSLKAAGALSNGLFYIAGDSSITPLTSIVQPNPAPQAAANCQCIIPLDATFNVVPFQWGTPPDYRNDDGSSNAINLPFNFCFYGQTMTTAFVNNNGNISFGTSYGTFSSASFPSNQYSMIAPFWADIDTRGLASGVVYYKVTPTAMIVRWQTVGYYSQHTDKLNDFQLIITDGNDPLLPPGSNCAFCYGDMQWTTGDASMGVNGFGGTAATVGCNLGDGVNYIQIGQFDAPGTVYNGPFGMPSQVSWLDNQQFFLDVCSAGGGGNLPPIMNSAQVCDTIDLCVGDTLQLTAQFLSPENNQLTTASASATGTGLTVVGSAPGNPVNLNAYFVGLQSNIGYNLVTISGTDNGTPAQTTNGLVAINVIPGPTAVSSYTGACPNDSVLVQSTGTVSVNGPIVSYHWDFGMPALSNDTSNLANSGYPYTTPGTYTVILEVTDSIGCSDTAMKTVTVYELPNAAFIGDPLTGCSPLCVDFTDQTTVINSTPAQWFWDFGFGMTSTQQNPQNCFYDQGSYSIKLVVTSAQGCKDSLTLTNYIDVIPGPVAGFTFGPQPATLNNPLITFTDQSTGGTIEWLWDFGDGSTPSTLANPAYAYSDTGAFTVMQIVSGPNGACPDTAYETVVISPELLIWVPNSFTPNSNGNNDVFAPVFSGMTYVKDYKMMIFDRWGMLVFSTTDPYQAWNGQYNNSPVQMDTYVYKIFVEDLNGNTHYFIGGVNLVK
jgi:gliding motility-associated-like protein